MSDRELIQQALDALDLFAPLVLQASRTNGKNTYQAARAALREHLAQPEQEPVAYRQPPQECR